MGSLIWTGIGLLAGVAVIFLANWQSGRPPRDDLKVRFIPWRIVMIVAAFWCLLMVVHAFNVFGIETGPDKSPFMRGLG